MSFGRPLKILAISLAVLVAVSIATVLFATIHIKDVLKAEITQRLPAVTQKLGLSLKHNAVSFNLFTGPSLQRVSLAPLTSDNNGPSMSIESIGLLYSFHLKPTFHVRIDGVELVGPSLQLTINDDDLTELSNPLMGLIQKGPAENILGTTKEADVPVEVAQQLKLVWRQGQLTINDERSELSDPPMQLALRGMFGTVTYDRQSTHILLETAARVAEDGGKLGATVARRDDDVKLAFQAEDLRFDRLAGFLPSVVVPSAATSTKLKLTAQVKDHVWDTDFSIELSDVALNHWRLAAREIRDIDILLSGKLQYDAAAQRIQFDRLNIDTNGLVLKASGHAEFADGFKLDTLIESDRVPIQEALNAIPKGFAPALQGAKVDGTIKIGMDFGVATTNLRALKFVPNIEIEDFELIKASSAVDIEKLKQPFMHQAKKQGEVATEFMVGRPNYRFVPYSRLGKNTIKGVMTCEDGSFFRHNGFRLDHFRESLIQDLREKRFARGASTITMQTAKNLFLTGEKTLSRKFQEILIAYAMEQILTKQRILEIYMNIIEWGPKIYGIGAASKHYFSKWPKDLDPLEAAFLGSIIPTPVRSHRMYSRGHVPDHWATYLALIVSKMGIHGKEYAELDPFQPEFDWVKKKRLVEEKKRQAEEGKRKVKKSRRYRSRAASKRR